MPREQSFLVLNTGRAGILRFDTAYYNGLPALPNKIFEYMSVGLAVIGSKLNKDVLKIIDEENCGIALDHETGADLAKAIMYFEENPEICKQMGVNSLKAVRQKYNWDIYGKLLDRILNGTIK